MPVSEIVPLWFMTPAVFIFGTIIGSFLNVLILRSNTGRSLSGRSGCFSCGAQLAWWQLVPVLSYIFLRGRCTSCGSRISLQYPIGEMLTGLLFVVVWFTAPTVWLVLFGFALVAALVYVTMYDIRHTIIPDKAVVVVGLLAISYWLLAGNDISLHTLLAHLAGSLVATVPLFTLWFGSRGRAMGFGDVTLGAVLGFFGGWSSALVLLWCAFVSGGLVGAGLLLWAHIRPILNRSSLSSAHTPYTMKSEVPFGPFVVFGFMVSFFFGAQFTDLVALFTFL